MAAPHHRSREAVLRDRESMDAAAANLGAVVAGRAPSRSNAGAKAQRKRKQKAQRAARRKNRR